ncbi:unnamed protein product [Paramecium sonneborni]|uniref:Uncharacterized protein n=1 Tax=Paramecium sonneborni TaxID=65129 RepID=A0A8S1KXX4_9CILI|nr:unnamed protein product [Paramecium sonneborni]
MMIVITLQEQTQLESQVQINDLEKLNKLESYNLDCDKDLLKLQQSLLTWMEIQKNKNYLEDDMNNLSALKLVIANIKNNENPELAKLFQYRQSYIEVVNQISLSEETTFNKWRQEGPQKLIQSMNLIEQAESIEDILKYCTQIDQMINLLINEREELKQELTTQQLLVDKLEEKSKEVQKALEQCRLKQQQQSVKDTECNEQEVQQKLVIEDNGLIHESSVDQEKPVFENTIEKEKDFIEYGYGYWLRFLTLYPKRLENGKNAPWYFLSRLTLNKNYQNIAMNDRLLALWLGQGFYHFTTCDLVQNQPNLIQNINHHDDIDGQWTYIYYSYNSIFKQAIGIIQFGNENPQQITHNVLHTKSKYLRFLVGGKDNNQYPGFNGQFSSIFLSTNQGVFIPSLDKFIDSFKTVKIPTQDFESIFRVQLIDQEITRNPSLEGDYMAVGGGSKKFPLEYSLSGWFKWEDITQQVWHSVFRVQINKPSTDKFLGDRTLCMFIGTAQGGIFHFPTYSYQNMKGEGTSNLVNNINHKNKHIDWFFVYFGYSKKLKKAFVQVRLSSGIETLECTNVNHYFTPQFHTYVGKDEHFPGFNGKIAYVNFVLGSGSYRNKPDFIIKDDLFGYDVGDINLIKKTQKQIDQQQNTQPIKEEPQVIKPSFQDNEDREVSFETIAPVLEEEYEEPIQMYGYGFWLRFMHVYPKRLLQGKNAPWYFISRLTSNKKYDNVQMGDRLLAIWLGQSYYHFTTCDIQKNQGNIIQNIDYPTDIEGVWTYIHYSYNKQSQMANSFIRYSQTDIQSMSIQAQHPNINYLKFIFGGNDENRYPGFNGFISKIMITISKDNLLETKDQFIEYISKLEQPKVGLIDQITYEIVQTEMERQESDDPIDKTLNDSNQQFPQEYAISGWFKWIGSQRSAWHNIFRVQIQSPSTDIYLGDRTLCMWLGSIEGGVLHFPTYSYDDINTKSNPNYYQNIKHNQRHLEWFYIYFGYQRTTRLAQIQVIWPTETQDLLYQNINHYLTPSFYLFIGKDKFYPGLQGKMAYVYFNLGNGSFQTKNEISDTVESYLKGSQVIKPQIPLSQQKQLNPSQEIKQPDQEPQKQLQGSDPLSNDNTDENYSETPELKSAVPSDQIDQPQFQEQIKNKDTPTNQPLVKQSTIPQQSTINQQSELTKVEQINNNSDQKQNINQTKEITQTVDQITEQSKKKDEANQQINLTNQNQQNSQTVNVKDEKVSQTTSQINQNSQQTKQQVTQQENQQIQKINEKTQVTNQTTQQTNETIQQNSITTQQSNEKNQENTNISQQTNKTTQKTDDSIQQGNQNTQIANQKTETSKQAQQQSNENIQQTNSMTNQQTKNSQNNQTTEQKNETTQQTNQITSIDETIQQTNQANQQINKTSQQNNEKTLQTEQINKKSQETNEVIIESNKEIQSKNQKNQSVNENTKEVNETRQEEIKKVEEQQIKQKEQAEFKIIDHKNDDVSDQQTIDMPIQEGDFCVQNEEEEPDKIQEVKIIPGQTYENEISNDIDGKNPIVDQGITVANDYEEYGYGFWMRYLTLYPKELIKGKEAPWYFISRLSRNKNYENMKMSDRVLAIWQGAGYYHFTTYDIDGLKPNVLLNVDYPNDIEGVWTYIYYSYSRQSEQAIGHIKFGNQKFSTIKQNVKHAPTIYLRFILGGNDQDRYPAFNGIFTKITFGIRAGTFIQSSEQLIMKLNVLDVPHKIIEQVQSVRIVENAEERTSQNIYEYKEIKNKKVKFPTEYALSGWFKWSTLMEKEWHNLFRIQIRKQSTDSFLGDRTLSCWLGKTRGGVYQFPTYTYTNMIGNGNANLYKNINLNDRNIRWHYIYFGYSKIKSQANVYVKWQDDEDKLLYENVNHYYVNKLYAYIGKDKFYSGLNGKMAYVVVNFGFGAYRNQKQFDEEIFNFNIGIKELIKTTEDVQFQPIIKQEKIESSGFDLDQPSFEQVEDGEKPFNQYGYGFWMRFLTLYPKKLQNGKTAPWYFVSRLTWNQNYNDLNMGDRVLAIFLGKGFYQFSTCNLISKNTNQEQRVSYPDNIEGVWTFVYYSYNKELGKAIGFIRFGQDKFQQIQHTQVTHQDTKYLKLIIGGTDQKRYPGFNGQFSKISFSSKDGSYIDQEKILKSYTLERRVQKVITMNVLGDQQQRKADEEGVFAQSDKVDLPTEYAISGWFKWLLIDKQKPLHNMFKVTIRNPSDDQLGDNTLVAYVGIKDLQFSTYSFENMEGSGNKNIQRSIEHKNRHYRWYFIYFGYQQDKSTCHIHVQWSEEMQQQGFTNIKHYLTNQFFIYIGKEPLSTGFNGLITQIKFNIGEGAYKQTTDYKDKDNIFGFDLQTINKEIKSFDINKFKEKLIIDSNSDEESNYLKVFNKDELDEVFEYGYGFWLRYLRNYPKVQIDGLKTEWSFISRLTKNDVLQDITLGDRTLAVWLGKGFYHFTTYNQQLANIFNNVNHPADIEGLWTFIHYSHNLNKEQSVSFIQFGNDKPIKSVQQSIHLIPSILKFYLGGRHLIYKGFNGQISGAYVSVNKGIFIDKDEKFEDLIKSIPSPTTYRIELVQNVLMDKNTRFEMNSEAKQFEYENQKFSEQYSWSGWFKWSSVIQNAWHLAVRLSTLENYENKNSLGDRTLCLWVGQQAGGILYFSTYTYTDLYGSGNPNSVQNVQYKDDIAKWHFIYFGYSRVKQMAYAKVEFGFRKEEIMFKDHHHYLPNKFFLSVGRDKWHDPYLGNIAFLRFQSGEGAFHQGEFKEIKDDLFANKLGSMELSKSKLKFDLDKDATTKMFSSPQVEQKEPIFSKIYNEEELDNISEYGYGFWCRFLTRYPSQLIEGLKADWSFISRLTKNQNKGDMNYGDRTLAIWLGKGFYHFTTYSHKYANIVHNIDHPGDIEGLWTFIYFSHNLYKKESIAMIKFGEGKVIKGVIPAIHQSPIFLQLYIGGNNMNYAAYNGQFAGIVFSIGEGIFLQNETDLERLLDKLKKPNDYSLKLSTRDIIGKPKQSFVAQETIFEDVPLVGQYSWSGWFKWKQMGQQFPWYLMVRLAIIKNTSDIKLLGDRTLMAFMGQGYIHFTTYSYKNIYGEGTPNIWQNINHDGEHIQWHFVYFGYSRQQRLAYGRIQFDDRIESVSFKETNHFIPNSFALTIGKDKWFNQYNGDIGFFKFNTGEASFQMDNYDKVQNDIFGFKIGRLSTINPNKPSPEELRQHEYFDNSLESDKIIEAEKFKNEKTIGIVENHYQFPDQDKQRVISDGPIDIIKPPQEKVQKEGEEIIKQDQQQQQNKEQKSDWEGLRFYGYGFYLRLTWNPQPQDVGMGDRVLSIFQGQGSYSFHTLDKPSNNPNLRTIIPYADIEGVWTFVYFSYSQVDKKAVAFIKYDDNAELQRRDIVCNHGEVEYLKLMIGGKQGIYQGFNGQIANYAFKYGKGAYINDFELYKRVLSNRIPHPFNDDYKFKQISIIEGSTSFKGDDQTDNIKEIESHFQNEYSISGWLRWDQAIGLPFYAIFRLSGYKVEENNDSKLGDRDMMLFKHTSYYLFQSYNYHNLNGAGDFAINWQVNHQEWDQFWHFFYIGYKRENKQLYYYISFIDDEFDQVHNNIHHYIIHKHYLQFGRDCNKFYSKFRGFTGQATQVMLSYGKGSYQTKPFNNDIFLYMKGIKELFSSLELTTKESDRNKLLIADSGKQGTLMDLEINDGTDYNIRGLNEYGWALWCRWSRTLNKPIQFKDAWYSIARIANRKAHQDLAIPGDRTLATWLGQGFYLFSTYSRGVLQLTESIPYGNKLEGQWNFIVFVYRKNVAKASVLFGQDSNIIEKEFKVKHNLVKDYLRFIVGSEFNYKFFNGHLTNIQLRLGTGAYLSKEEIVIIANGELGLPSDSKFDQSRKTIEIIKERISNAGQGREFDIKEEIAQGKLEYSISGWAKWVDIPSIQPWYVLYRVTYYDYNELLNMQIPGSRIFSCHKGYGFYHFNTYTVDQENGGAWQIVKNIDYDQTLHKNWVYFYQGYSHQKQQVHLYLKYPGQEEHFTFTKINHFIAQRFKIHFLLDRWNPGFNGYIESWYFNVGQGSYKENGFGIGENEETTFGFGLHKPAQPKNWQFDDNYGCGFTQQIVGQEVEYKDDLQIDGLMEYGYGMWTRFAWNTPIKMVNKPAWLSLSRLTVNPNYQGDAAQLGDRALAIWIGPGFYQFVTSTRGNFNVINNVEYDQMLDGQWNYIWFGYKRINDKQGSAIGYVVFDGLSIRKTNFGNIIQQPLNDYLYLAVGSSGRYFLDRYHQFNGHIQKVSLILGHGGFFEHEDQLRKQIPAKPEFLRNQKLFSKIVVDEVKVLKREEWVPSPVEFIDEFDGAYEYSVSLWFKWTKIYRVAWENVFSVSYNEQNIRANHAKPGDRVLSMFQYADHRIFFSTYTTPNNHDQFAHLYTECPVDIPSQSEWVYGYYGYSRNQNKVISYLQTKTQKCLKALSCMHRVPKYMGLYVGKDGIHTPYNGKFSKLYFMGHLGSYIEGNFQSFEPFAAGGISITKPAYFWSEQKERFEIAYDQNKVFELKPEEVDEQTSYSIGMWTKYYTAIPKRLLQKPDWLHIARLTINQNHKNYENIGDRTLAIFIGRQYYGFFTYNAINNNPNIVQNIRYDDNLEGEWNFIYFSYSSELQLAAGFVMFSKLNKIQRIQFRDIQHKPIENYAKLVIGNEFSYQGFNGQITNLQLGFGQRYYVHDSDGLNKMILEFYNIPQEDGDDNRKVNIVEEMKERVFNNGPDYKEILDQKGTGEYAMYGWFRYTSTQLKSSNNCIMRLTNNEQGYRGEISRVGDRTLLVMLQPGEYVFATYSLGNIDNGLVVNIRKPTPYKSNLGLWTYIYFGYHFQKRKASGIIRYPSGDALIPYDNILHMVPNYLLFFFGGDGMLGGWHGQMQKVNLLFGKGSFVDSTKGNYEEKLPNLHGVETKPLIWDGIDNKIIEVPIIDKPALDIVFNKDVNGFTEYGYGLWTRWLTTIPLRIVEKAPFHQLIRLTSTEQYEDAVQLGNRVLAIWVGKGYYHFTTYNKIGNKISISQNINYDDNLEGEWNYMYFSFTNKQQARAVGFVYFSEQSGTAISRVEFLNLEHVPINGYARVVAANKEFGYQSFNGMIADLQIHLGNGFVGSREQLIKEIIQLNPKPPIDIKSKMDVNLIKEEVIIKPEEKKDFKYKYEEYKGVNEYAVSGWLQSKVMGLTEAYKNVYRLTINSPDFQRDKQYAGDRTLSLFQSKTKLAFSTYTYGNLDTQGDDSNEFNRIINSDKSNGEWVFVYFGYQFKSKQAFAFTLFLNHQDSAQFNNIKHFVPNQFFFYLSNDGYYPIFDGSLFDWNLYFGDGAYTNKPRQIINQWPVEPIVEFEGVISALLSNKGLNSMKVIRPDIKEEEEIIFKNNFPKSGIITGNPSPRSGQTQVDAKEPKSGAISVVKQPQSGQFNAQQQQQSVQQQQQTRKPLSGIADSK